MLVCIHSFFTIYSFFLLILRRPPRSTRTDTLFPTRRSSDLPALIVVNHEQRSPAIVFGAQQVVAVVAVPDRAPAGVGDGGEPAARVIVVRDGAIGREHV